MATSLPPLDHVWFHRDYDGAVAAAMVASCLERAPQFEPLDFVDNDAWPERVVPPNTAVLDFPYHASAVLWIDHHDTGLSRRRDRAVEPAGAVRLWDPSAASCPELIVRQPWHHPVRPLQGADAWLRWSRVIDSALYASAAQAMDEDNPHLLLAAAIPATRTTAGAAELVAAIGALPAEDVARLPSVAALGASLRELDRRLVSELRRPSSRRGAVVVLDQSDTDLPYRRYLPYVVHPDVRYAIGVYATSASVVVSVGENPWRRSGVVHLGELCRTLGGGGRASTAGVPVPSRAAAGVVVEALVRALSGVTLEPSTAGVSASPAGVRTIPASVLRAARKERARVRPTRGVRS